MCRIIDDLLRVTFFNYSVLIFNVDVHNQKGLYCILRTVIILLTSDDDKSIPTDFVKECC